MVTMSLLAPIFFILLAVKDSGAAVSAAVTLSPNWNNVYSGDMVTLSCPMGSAVERYSYTWYKDGNIMSEKNQSFIVSGAGVYKCSVKSNIFSYPIQLHVIPDKDALRPVVTLSPNWNKVLSGDKVTLSCSLDLAKEKEYNDYYYTWYRNNEIFSYEKSIEMATTEAHSGVYTCSVKFVHSVPVQLDVITQDVLILQTPPDVVEGDSLSLRCHSKYRDNNNMYFYNDGQWSHPTTTLYIPNVTTAETRMYQCGTHIDKNGNNTWKTAQTYLSVQDLFTSPKVKNDVHSIREDDDMTLRCDTRINPIRSGTQLLFAFYRDRRIVKEFDLSDIYKVTSVQLEDSGSYTCEVRTVSDTVRKMSDGLYFQVQRSAVTPVVTLTPNWNQLYKGDSVTLSCNMGSVEVQSYWYKGEQQMHWQKQYKTNVKVTASEVYKCSTDETTYSHPVRLNVISNGKPDRPVVTISSYWGIVFENEMITLTCSTTKTQQNYVWVKDGTQIRRQPYQNLLKLDPTNIGDSGYYQCGSWNDRSSSVRLEVINNAYLILQAPLDVIEGDSFNLRCHSLPGYEDEVETFFYKDNESLKSIKNILHISNVNTTMSGMYKCKKYFIQRDRWISAKAYISVQDLFTTPKMKSNLSPVQEGDGLTLTCDTRLNPLRENTKLQFAFYRDGRTVRGFGVSESYKVESAKLEDSGKYTCEVKTVSASVKKYSNSVSVQIQELFTTPEIKVTPYRVIEGDEMTVRCDTRPNRIRVGTELLFAFYRDGRIVRGFDVSDTYRVRSAQLKDSGTYTCEVRTASDTVRKNSNKLLVQIQELFTSPQIRVNQSFPMEEGKWAALECVTVPNGSPSLRYVFYKDSEMIQDADMRSSYVIVRAREEHTGNYWCSVQIRDGSVRKNSTHAHILVQHPISGVNIIVNKGDMNFVYGKSLTFDCSVEKGTSPSFLWLHNETVVEKDSDLYQLRDNGTVLYIESLQSHHIGSYRCNVSNKLPQTSSNKLNSITNIVWISQISEDPPPGSNIVWPVLGVLAFIPLLVIILVFINRSKFPSLISSLSRHQKQQNSESMPDKDNPRDDGRSANEGTNRSNDIDNNEHLYSNVSSGQVEDDVCYTYIDIKQIQASKGKINNKDEPPVVYSVLRPVAKPKMIQATPVTDDSAKDMRIYQMPP